MSVKKEEAWVVRFYDRDFGAHETTLGIVCFYVATEAAAEKMSRTRFPGLVFKSYSRGKCDPSALASFVDVGARESPLPLPATSKTNPPLWSTH